MKKLMLIASICLILTLIYRPASSAEHTVWIKVTDQFDRAITEADVFYCQDEACRHQYNEAPEYNQTTTNGSGYAELKIGDHRRINIQGVTKDGYDIRLDSLPFRDIALRGKLRSPYTDDRRRASSGIEVKFENEIEPYSLPRFRPIFVLTGYKLGPSTCLEQDRRTIMHSGSAASRWEIDGAEYYYQLGDQNNALRDAEPDNFDFKITINRSRYPWHGLISWWSSRYRLDFEFPEGGAQLVDPGDYIHLAPRSGYSKKFSLKYRGIGEVSTAHEHKLFVKIGERYGVINLFVSPSQKLFFEYLISREDKQRQLNFPSYVDDRGRTMNYFSCVHDPPRGNARRTLPGACAELAGMPNYRAC